MIVVFALAENSIQLVPDGTLLIHLMAVALMIAVLNRTLYKPINKILFEREQQTKGRLTEAEKALRETETKLSQYERSLREARSAGYRLVEAERSSALAASQTSLESLRKDMRSLVVQEKLEIGAQVEVARGALESESRRTAEHVGAQILDRTISSTPYSS